MTPAADAVLFDGTLYPVKEFDGYRFAPASLAEVLLDIDGGFVSPAAERLDATIAYYFDNPEFDASTPEQLFQKFP